MPMPMPGRDNQQGRQIGSCSAEASATLTSEIDCAGRKIESARQDHDRLADRRERERCAARRHLREVVVAQPHRANAGDRREKGEKYGEGDQKAALARRSAAGARQPRRMSSARAPAIVTPPSQTWVQTPMRRGEFPLPRVGQREFRRRYDPRRRRSPDREMDDLGDLGRMEQHGAAGVGVCANEAVELVLGADVDAARRIEQQQDAAFGQQPFGDGDLLLVAAGERADAGPQCAAVDVDPLKDGATAAVSRGPSISGPRAKRSMTGSDALCLPLSFRDSASVLRSSGTRLMPILARTASAGDVMTIGSPSISRCPAVRSAMPKQARKRSSWPMP